MNDQKFDKPLDQDIMEPQNIDREVVELDPDSRTFKRVKVTEQVMIKTRYTKASTSKLTCKAGTHFFKMIDRHKYIAGCRDCKKHHILRPDRETIDKNGHIINRQTKEILD